jgi:hypothetical protein
VPDLGVSARIVVLSGRDDVGGSSPGIHARQLKGTPVQALLAELKRLVGPS